MSLREHFTRDVLDKCPVCGMHKRDSGVDGYRDYDFTESGVYFTYVCPNCGDEFHEAYEYAGTYHYTHGEEQS